MLGGPSTRNAAVLTAVFADSPADDPTALRVDVLRWRLDGAGVKDQDAAAWVVPARGGRVRRVTDDRLDVLAPRWISNLSPISAVWS